MIGAKFLRTLRNNSMNTHFFHRFTGLGSLISLLFGVSVNGETTAPTNTPAGFPAVPFRFHLDSFLGALVVKPSSLWAGEVPNRTKLRANPLCPGSSSARSVKSAVIHWESIARWRSRVKG